MSLETLKKRSSFLYVREGDKWITPSFVLQVRKQPGFSEEAERQGPRYGFTASKKIGNAVKRNLAKRRLREAVRHLGFDKGHSPSRWGYDYVLIARQGTLKLSFDEILKDMHIAFERVHKKKKRSSIKR